MTRIAFDVWNSTDNDWRKSTHVNATLGDWPYEPGGSARIRATGTQRANPRKDAPVWEVTTDDSDDPYKPSYRTLARDVTYAEAKRIATQAVTEQTERRAKQGATR